MKQQADYYVKTFEKPFSKRLNEFIEKVVS